MRGGAVLLSFILLSSACLTLLAIKPSNVHSAAIVTSHRFPDGRVPTIDGYFEKASEWNTTRIEIIVPAEKVLFYVGHDDKYLYILEDFTTDTEIYGTETKGDQGWVYIDKLHDGGTTPKIDDFMIDLEWVDIYRNQHFVWRGDGKGWAREKIVDDFYWNIQAKSSMGRSPNSETPHLIYEFRVPLNFDEQTKTSLSFNEGITVGLRLRVYDHNRQVGIEFPLGSSPLTPKDWACLMFSSLPIPEFPGWLTPATLTATVTIAFQLAPERTSRKRSRR